MTAGATLRQVAVLYWWSAAVVGEGFCFCGLLIIHHKVADAVAQVMTLLLYRVSPPKGETAGAAGESTNKLPARAAGIYALIKVRPTTWDSLMHSGDALAGSVCITRGQRNGALSCKNRRCACAGAAALTGGRYSMPVC